MIIKNILNNALNNNYEISEEKILQMTDTIFNIRMILTNKLENLIYFVELRTIVTEEKSQIDKLIETIINFFKYYKKYIR